jgi:sRNA-binding carbon storage regulator CsrA
LYLPNYRRGTVRFRVTESVSVTLIRIMDTRHSVYSWRHFHHVALAMLVITENVGWTVLVGSGIKVQVLGIRGRQARLGFDAPPGVLVTAGSLDKGDRSATTLSLSIGGLVRIGTQVSVKLLGIHGRRVRLGFDAPLDIKVERAVVAMCREVNHPSDLMDDVET